MEAIAGEGIILYNECVYSKSGGMNRAVESVTS